MSSDAQERRLSRFWYAVFIGIAGTVAGLGVPGLLCASETIVCDAPLLIASSPQRDAQLGWAIAISEDEKWLAAGANHDNARAGSVSMYLNPGPGTPQTAKIIPGDLQSGDQFGSSVSISGNWMAVGAPGKAQDSGVVYLFHLDGETWGQSAKLAAADAAQGAQFGFSVSLSASRGRTTLVVGAPGDSGRGSLSGAAYVFALPGETQGTWNQTKLLANDGRPFDKFGSSVATDGGEIVVGAPFADDLTVFQNFGAAYVFKRVGGGWTLEEQGKLTAGPFRAGNIQFGAAVAIGGDRIVSGAPGYDNANPNLTDSGSAYVFERSGSAGPYGPPILLTPDDPGENAQFGTAVQIAGNRVLIGAPFDGLGLGAAYLFEQSNRTWRQSFKIRRVLGGAFGQSVAILGDQVFLGGFHYTVDAAANAGAVATCSLREPSCASSISKTDHRDTVKPGETVIYQIDVVAARPGTTVNDTFPPGLEAVGWCRGKDCTNFVQQDLADSLPSGGDATYLVRGQVRDGATGELTNKACVERSGCTKACASDTDQIQNQTPGRPEIRVIKDDGLTQVAPGQTVQYKITVSNIGDGNAPAVQVKDQFSTNLRDVSWCYLGADPNCASPIRGDINLTIPLASGQKAVFTATGTVAQNACGTLTNQACAQLPDGRKACGDDPSDRITQPVDLALTDPRATCGTLGYTLVITNPGPVANGVQVTARTPTGLTPLAPADARCGIAAGNIVCALGSVAAGATVKVPISFTVPDCYAGNPIPAIAFLGPDCDPAHDQASISIPVVCKAKLVVEKTGPASVAPGDSLPYSLKVTNLGPDPACGVSLTDPIPPSLGSPSAPGCIATPNEIQCLKDKLSQGESSTFGVTFKVLRAAVCNSQIVNTVTARALNADPQSARATTTVTCCSLTISKTDGLTTAMPGQGLLYTIVVGNPGAGACAVDGATVSDICPGGLTKAHWCRGAACTPIHPGNLLDTLSLPAGGSETYQFSGIVSESFGGPLINTATATAPTGTVSASDTTDIGFIGVKAFCDGLQGVPVEGGAMMYTFVLVNHGPAAQADNPGDEFTDTLPAGLTLTGASASSGTASASGNTAKWNGAISVGGSVTITITATINAGTVGMTLCNQATIAFDADGDGINESTGLSDDPGEPGTADPCCFRVLPPSPPGVPALSGTGLVALALLLAGLALLRLRRRSL